MKTKYLATVFVFGLGACAADVDSRDIGAPALQVSLQSITVSDEGDKAVVLRVADNHSLEFVASADGAAFVFEQRPLAEASVLPDSVSAVDFYRELAASAALPELFGEAYSAAPTNASEVGLLTAPLSKEDFLAGDGICKHRCGTTEFQEYSTYPFESAEKCRTDIVGRDFRGDEETLAAADTAASGEKFFFAANARDVGGTLRVHRYQQEWTFEGSTVVDYRQSSVTTRTRVIERGQAFAGGFTVTQPAGRPNVYRRGTVWADLVGDDDAVYDYYTCAALSRSTPSASPGQ